MEDERLYELISFLIIEWREKESGFLAQPVGKGSELDDNNSGRPRLIPVVSFRPERNS